ncbi:UDP-N-acetylmuramoyl-tripeptide--D-alanyl-D-alanine ligase [Paractinoplanes rishiriensis]|uniref:UDP-N-acetylmuramoyl-tripeptide--D-alanyl-D-alanine ligase n=1 Tax=Paractinoplanes rishiriensis TaxID=1050105 RepID=A0A919JVG2_9ACTN|nr:UDP-N-acetylmuramoyl-tripeptide--D-alanyl-D-alanine ligase [Actinoplanes rishiriensis]GIE93873.1 UDP-N-acetylmuramoyl-tripeptide--D-alanyl-D-alanine ligase [Actinoplanes rishiriensis]
MLPLTLAEIAAEVGGALHDANPQARVTGLCTFDSRTVEPGSLFVALAGARVDGHDFARQAIAAGATVVLSARPLGVPAIVVDDPLKAYGRLATAIVSRLPGLGVVGVTGSVGKTTTKDLLGQVLARLGPTTAPPGNRNSESGMPENVSRLVPGTEYLVLEMGARHVGDIAYLTSLVRPDVGVVLTVGTAHLGEFGSRENIALAKGEMVETLAAEGTAVLNADDPLVAAMANRTKARVVTFGLSPEATVRAEGVTLDAVGRASFMLHSPHGSAPVSLRLHGAHLVPNALAAAAATMHFTTDVAFVADALSAAEAVSKGRMEVVEGRDGVTVINDAYNASLVSMVAALNALDGLAAGRRRKIAVLGQMNELGDSSAADHRVVGEKVAEVGVDWLLAVGNDDAGLLAETAARCGVAALHVPDSAAARAALAEHVRADDVVLLKGSNSVGLMAVAAELAATPA